MELLKHHSESKRLLLAIPKKGRLHQLCLELLAGAEVKFSRHNRHDIALVQNLPITLIFLPAADIPQFVGEGNVDVGITGQDQREENALRNNVDSVELLLLNFGHCKLQVQVPQQSSLSSPEQLMGKKVVTSFTHLTQMYFDKLRKTATNKTGPSIKYAGGSVEVACSLGLADGIVDLVESGETMRAAGLKAVDTVMESQAVLIGSKSSSGNQATRDLLIARFKGVITARRYVLCTYNILRRDLPSVRMITPGKRAPTIVALDDDEWVSVSAMIEKRKTAEVMDQLEVAGASDILITQIINSRA